MSRYQIAIKRRRPKVSVQHNKTIPDKSMCFMLNHAQVEKFEKWRKRHDKTCSLKLENKEIRFSFRFRPTGLGNIVQAWCICGKKIDLTPDDWGA